MRDEDSWATAAVRTLILTGAAWCGAVLSIAFGNSEHVRWWSALAGAPMLTVVGLSLFAKPTAGRAKLMLALTAASGVVLLFSTGLVLGGFAPLSDGGRWKRALAALSTVAIVLELRRLSRQPPPSEQPTKDENSPPTPYLSVLTFGSLAEGRHEGGRDDLVPVVRTETDVFSEHLVGPLWIHYAVESKRALATVTAHELNALGVDLGAARALAIENLRRRLPPAHFTGHSGVYRLTLAGEGGHFEASLLLLDEVWARAAPLVKGDVVAALPGRDLLLFTGTDDVEGLKKVRGMTADALHKGLEHSLTQQLFVRRDGGWRPFDVG